MSSHGSNSPTSHTTVHPDTPQDIDSPASVDQAIALSNAGAQAAIDGNYLLSAEKHAQALALRQQFYGLDSVQVGISANGLGEAMLALGRLDDAEQALMVALRCRDELGLGSKFDRAVTRENVGCLWEARGKWEEAREVRLRGTEAGMMACGNGKVSKSAKGGGRAC